MYIDQSHLSVITLNIDSFRIPGFQSGGRDPFQGCQPILKGQQSIWKENKTLPICLSEEKS